MLTVAPRRSTFAFAHSSLLPLRHPVKIASGGKRRMGIEGRTRTHLSFNVASVCPGSLIVDLDIEDRDIVPPTVLRVDHALGYASPQRLARAFWFPMACRAK